MNILFINGSPNRDGNTAALAARFLQGHTYETLNLTDYRINVYGQELPGDQFSEVLEKVRAADFIVIGSPLYWHNICGAVRNLLDRFYGPVEAGSLHGQIAFLFQGAAPEKWMLEAGEYTMRRFAANAFRIPFDETDSCYGLTYLGMVTSVREADVLAAKIG